MIPKRNFKSDEWLATVTFLFQSCIRKWRKSGNMQMIGWGSLGPRWLSNSWWSACGNLKIVHGKLAVEQRRHVNIVWPNSKFRGHAFHGQDSTENAFPRNDVFRFTWIPPQFPELEQNFCRNPSKSHMPWCFTERGGVSKQYCQIKRCHEVPLEMKGTSLFFAIG